MIILRKKNYNIINEKYKDNQKGNERVFKLGIDGKQKLKEALNNTCEFHTDLIENKSV